MASKDAAITALQSRFVSVKFRNYKALKNYSIRLRSMNVLVGPNNAGKSTILGAFRILAEGVRKAASRSPEPVRIERKQVWGYRISLEDLPISTENVFTDYDDSEPARVTFGLSNKNELELIFPEVGSCILVARTGDLEVRSPSEFRRAFPVSIGYVPILGPVEHDEPLFQKEAARKALMTHRASRNFRNIWFHFPEEFDEFRGLIQQTWPGMDIEKPRVSEPGRRPKLVMFCPEKRYPREIFWAGFGFQVWCQLLTYALRARLYSILIVDEPDIYLHSDLQRQLIAFLQGLGPDILIATHSTEIVSESDPNALLVINRRYQHAQHVTSSAQLQDLFGNLGSNLNPVLTQLAKTKRCVFVEGKDFSVLALFARRLGKVAVANRTDFAVVPVEGFAPKKVIDIAEGFKLALGGNVSVAVVLDRDFRSDEEIAAVVKALRPMSAIVHVHSRKELENYLIVPGAIQRALERRVRDNINRGGKTPKSLPVIHDELDEIAGMLKSEIFGQFMARRVRERKALNPELDSATLNTEAINDFERRWSDRASRFALLPGKRVFAALNGRLQAKADVAVTSAAVIEQMKTDEIPDEIVSLVSNLDGFRTLY
jgi:energy-coupling factor transporter ATP-binding protein EcfA2